MTPRLSWGKVVTLVTCLTFMSCVVLLPLAACSTILGIEKGEPYDDGGSLEDASPPVPQDSGGDAPAKCAPGDADVFICNGRCGKIKDSCGNEVDCGATCAGSLACNETKHLCECTAPDWCHGRCGESIDYCGVKQTCTCSPGSVCNTLSGFCGNCIPNPLACNGKNCGYADNGCAKQSCGTCGANQHCRLSKTTDTAGSCCTPRSRDELCQGKCAGIVIDLCTSRAYDCGAVNHCPEATELCKNNSCCLRDEQPCELQSGAKPCCSGHCAASVDAGDGEVTPQTCVP